MHRVLMSCIGISQHVPVGLMYAVSQSLGFCVTRLYLRYQLRYVKGLFLALNSRSVYTRRMLRCTVMGAGLRPFAGSDWVFVCRWLPHSSLKLC